MIQAQADRLVTLIARQRELSTQVTQLEGFRGQLYELQRAVARFSPIVRIYSVFRERGIGNANGDVGVQDALRQVSQLAARYKTDRTSILGPNRLVSLRAVQLLGDTVQGRLLSEWQAYTATCVPSVNDDVLNVLSRIPALKASVNRVWAGLRELSDRMQRLPETAADIDAFEQHAKSVRAQWDAFDSGHLSPEVLRFLREAGGTGAGLESLTDSVRAWLSENKLATSFVIRSTASVAVSR